MESEGAMGTHSGFIPMALSADAVPSPMSLSYQPLTWAKPPSGILAAASSPVSLASVAPLGLPKQGPS